MTSDPSDLPPIIAPPDPRAGVATIRSVTDEMLDGAAHAAAVLADGVAHHASETADAATNPEPADATTSRARHDGAERGPAAGSAVAPVPSPASPGAVEPPSPETPAASGSDHRTAPPSAADALSRYNAAVLGIVQAQVTAAGDLVGALVRARSIPEVVAINADHLRRQADAVAAQGRSLTALAQALTFDLFALSQGRSRRDP